MINNKKNNNKKGFKIYLDGNPIDDIREFLSQYKGVKLTKKQKKIMGIIALACTCGLVTISGIKNSHAEKTETTTMENGFEGVPIPEEYLVAYQNEVVNSNRINESKVGVTLGNTKYIESKVIERNNPLDLNLGGAYEGFRYKLSEEELEPFFRYANIYGVDPYMIIALAAQESSLNHRSLIPGGSSYREGCAVGICQISQLSNWSVSATNMLTGNVDTLNLTLENISNYELNIKASCMMMQNSLNAFYGNPYLTWQAHNYGSGAVNIAVNCYAEQIGVTPSEVMQNFNDCGWIEYIQDIHDNPSKYFDWPYSTYGDANYVEHVGEKYCPDNDFISHYYVNAEPCTFNFITNQMTFDNQTTLTK